MVLGSKLMKVTYDTMRALNSTIWGEVSEAEKVGQIVKTELPGADVIVGTSHIIYDLACNGCVYCSLDIIGSISSAVGLVIGNIPSTKPLTVITGSVTVGCRAVRYYCKNYGTFWGCTVAAGQGIKETVKFVVKR